MKHPRRRSPARSKRYDRWTILGFVVFCLTAIYMGYALWVQKTQGITLPIHWILLGASMVAMLWTTGALKNGEFFEDFYECTRKKTPASFWVNVVVGYAFAAALIGLFVWELLAG